MPIKPNMINMRYQLFFTRLFFYLKPHISKLIFTSAMMALAAVLQSTIPEIIGQIADELFIEPRYWGTALFYAVVLFGAILISALFSMTSVGTSSWVSNKVIMDLRVDMFIKLLKLPKAYFDVNSTGKILSKFTFDVEQISAAASSIWIDFIRSSITVIALISYLFYKNWQLSTTLIILLPLVYIVVKRSSKRMRNASINVQNSMGEMTHLLDENILGNTLVKIYHAQTQERHKFNYLVKNIRQQRFKVDMNSALNSGVVDVLIGLSLGSIVYFSSILLDMTTGSFLSFFTAMGMLVKPAKNLVNINKPFQITMVAGKSVFGFIDEEEEQNDGIIALEQTKGAIQFKNVSFSYGNAQQVVSGINLEIKSGETVALVGRTGSGKSTIINLLAKFYLPDSGSISIDGKNINTLETNALRSQISFVDQKVRLFDDTIKNNIALGQINAMSDKTIQNAAKVANVDEFIQKLSDGFETKIGEDGAQLSGGQRQRIAIARAIAKNSPILILDEATSSLDLSTEKQVQSAVNAMQKGRTVIMITHRISAVQKADKIVVLEAGKIVEQGTHQQLLDKNGEYANLHRHQFKEG